MAKPKVYIHRLGEWYGNYMDAESEAYLSSFADVVNERGRTEPYTEEELIERMRGAEAVLSLNGMGTGELTPRVFREVGTVKLIVISHYWEQFSEIADELAQLGIRVVEGSNANTAAVAEWVMTAALMGVRRLTDFDAKMKAGSPWCEPRRTVGMLRGQKVGLVGMGRIGRFVTHLMHAFGAEVSVYDKYISDEALREMGVARKSLDEIFAQSDIVSLHLPVTPETTGMIGAAQFEKIRDGAVFINSARAELYDEEALIRELAKNRFTAFLDVYASEPLPQESPLRTFANVLITPHIAGDNRDMFKLCGRQAIDTLKAYFDGREIEDKKYAF